MLLMYRLNGLRILENHCLYSKCLCSAAPLLNSLCVNRGLCANRGFLILGSSNFFGDMRGCSGKVVGKTYYYPQYFWIQTCILSRYRIILEIKCIVRLSHRLNKEWEQYFPVVHWHFLKLFCQPMRCCIFLKQILAASFFDSFSQDKTN